MRRTALKLAILAVTAFMLASPVGAFQGYPPSTWCLSTPDQDLTGAVAVTAFDDPHGLMRESSTLPDPALTIPVDLTEFRRWAAAAQWSRITDASKVPPLGRCLKLSDGRSDTSRLATGQRLSK
ncbi:MAG: hypothetical protein SGJ09_03465 [Phycisphaerae bacterium]|nr:hypothetical protein [Phycisphaerae bacterium]